jgi:5-(aminomethyl)-3-furanmethanol phosphate kinase
MVREWDQVHQLGEKRAHWLALDALELTARLLETLWLPARLTRAEDYSRAWEREQIPLALGREWFEAAALRQTPAPGSTWETTTDTIAAWIAALAKSESLWLLKSVPCPASITEATERGWIDPQFVHWVSLQTPLRWVNLRDSTSLAINLLTAP